MSNEKDPLLSSASPSKSKKHFITGLFLLLGLTLGLYWTWPTAFVTSKTKRTVPTVVPSPHSTYQPSSNILSIEAPTVPFKQHPILPQFLKQGLQQQPIPTNAWWTNFLLSDGQGGHSGEAPVTVMPYTVQSMTNGLQISYGNSRRNVSSSGIAETFAADVTAGTREALMTREVVAFDELTVTLQWKSSADVGTLKGAGCRTVLARGSPYIVMEYQNMTPTITTAGRIVKCSVGNRTMKVQEAWTATQFEMMVENKGVAQLWTVASSDPVTWTLGTSGDGHVVDTLFAGAAFNGSLSMALVPESHKGALALLQQHAKNTPQGGTVSYDVRGATGILQFQWTLNNQATDNHTFLMVAHPHQVATMNKSSVDMISDLPCYRTVKGYATFILGNAWMLEDTLTSVGFDFPRAIATDKIPALTAALAQDVSFSPSKTDPYFFGKEVSRQARLVLLSDALNATSTRDAILTQLEIWMEPWLLGSNNDPFVYDTVWGGLCSKKGLNGVFWMTDFGNGWYSDHHFHYGYLIYTAAVIGRYRPAFVEKYRPQLLSLVRDIANPTSSDPYFPLARYFSWFDGHSFASGVFVLDGGKSQESVSEAINAYYAVYLLGSVMALPDLSNFGRILLASEMRAATTYWQMPSWSNIYEPEYATNKMTGQVASTKTVYTTWFGPLVENMHLINMIPFTPISAEFLSKAYMTEEYPLLQQKALQRTTLPLMTEGWKGYAYMAHAIVNASAAWSEVETLTDFDDGNSRSNAYYWIATRP